MQQSNNRQSYPNQQVQGSELYRRLRRPMKDKEADREAKLFLWIFIIVFVGAGIFMAIVIHTA